MPATTTITAPARVAITAAVAACGALNLTVLGWVLWTRPALNSDFLAFWSDARFAASRPLAGIYDANTLQNYQQALYPGFHSFYPFTYPPTFLLGCWWLGHFSFAAAEAIWTLAGLAAMVVAAWYFFARRDRLAGIAAMLASPACLLNAMAGQTAFFTTALLLAGFAALSRRPVVAGVAFGLLTLKPQLGVLIPVALLARGDWRAIAAAGATAASLIALSCLAFPATLWRQWAATLPVYQAQYFSSHGLNLHTIVTPAANLVVLGVAPAAAWAAQLVVSLLVAVGVFVCFRRASPGAALAALLCGGFLAVPHAYAYDTITLTVAMVLLLREARPPAALLALGLAVYLGPLLLLSPANRWFFYAAPEALLFIAIIILALGDSNRAIIADEPELQHAGS